MFDYSSLVGAPPDIRPALGFQGKAHQSGLSIGAETPCLDNNAAIWCVCGSDHRKVAIRAEVPRISLQRPQVRVLYDGS
jgi:hypothetical protein